MIKKLLRMNLEKVESNDIQENEKKIEKKKHMKYKIKRAEGDAFTAIELRMSCFGLYLLCIIGFLLSFVIIVNNSSRLRTSLNTLTLYHILNFNNIFDINDL